MSYPNPSKMSYDHKINIKDYPFYKFIPIEHISQKQKLILNKRLAEYNKHSSSIDQLSQMYEECPISPQQLHNCNSPYEYSEEYNEPIKQLETTYKDIQENNMKQNEQILEEQREKIKIQNDIIQNNIVQINETISVYSHNVESIKYQVYQMYYNNTEIVKKQDILESLNTQLLDTYQQVDDVNAQLVELQQELEYHSSILTSFNTVIQNPEYFAQLMNMVMTYNAEIDQYI
jgi:predicted RNase H-like nuclease (RuvC/YqgF family)